MREFRDEEDPWEIGPLGEVLVAKYMEEAAPAMDPAAVELEVEVEGRIGGVNVVGKVDLIDRAQSPRPVVPRSSPSQQSADLRYRAGRGGADANVNGFG